MNKNGTDLITGLEKDGKKKHKAKTALYGIPAGENLIHAVIACYFLHYFFMIAGYITAFMNLRRIILSNNIIYLLIALAAPVGIFIMATKTEYWNYHNHKLFLYRSVVYHAILVSLQPIYTFYWNAVIPVVLKIEITEAMTEYMVGLLGRVLLVVGSAGSFTIMNLFLKNLLFTDEVIDEIKTFKITHYVDERKNVENLYDLTIVNDLETSKPIRLKQSDRFLHVFVNGASGTGKTSSIFFPAILQDLKTKDRNKRERVKSLIQMLLKKRAYLDLMAGDIDEHCIHPMEGYEKEYDDICRTYRDCGIAVMAPDNSVVEAVLKLAGARHMQVCVLDPARGYEEYANYKKVGLNPFLIDLNLKGNALNIAVNDKAEMFAEVLLAVNERDEKSDVYFSNIMKNMCITVSKIAMLAAVIRGRQTNIVEIQQCITDPKNLIPMVAEIERYFGIFVQVDTVKGNGKTNSQARVEDFNGTAKTSVEKIAKAKASPYYQDILFVKDELLGASSQEMFNQARGLRIIMNIFLSDPRIKEVLTASEDNVLDLDKMLDKGELVVINTAAEFGQGKSTALGLFFLLNLKISVFKRPQPYENLSPFFVLVDEASQYMHRSLEDFITLFRKYWVGTLFAVQGLEQFDKSDLTKYLRGVFMKTGTQYVFGRLSKEEMDTYSILAGEFSELMEQETVSETSIFSDHPSKSRSVRTTPDVKPKMTGTRLRQLDFQELTVLTVNNGRVLDGKLGKVHFVKKKDYEKEEPFTVSWEELAQHVLVRTENGLFYKGEGISIDMEIPDEVQVPVTDAYLDAFCTQDESTELKDLNSSMLHEGEIVNEAWERGRDYGEKVISVHNECKEKLPDFMDQTEERNTEKRKVLEWWNVFDEN